MNRDLRCFDSIASQRNNPTNPTRFRSVRRLVKMKFPFLLASLVLLSMAIGVPVHFSQKPNGHGKRVGPKPTAAQMAGFQETSKQVRRVDKILKKAGYDIDAASLFTKFGRIKLRPKLATYGEMYLTKFRSEPFEGVVMADTLRLADNLNITDDTVIIARNIRFTGKKTIIKGPHDIHFFALDSIKAEERGASVVIDTSGRGRKEWLASQAAAQDRTSSSKGRLSSLAHHSTILPIQSDRHGNPGAEGNAGTNGQNGNNGVTGSNGVAGSCSTNKNGGNGGTGTAGSNGTGGSAGGNGSPGENGGAATLTITDPNDTTSYFPTARGGDGGRGGAGGSGGTGGSGGSGGNGGDGAGCSCAPGGIGDGGNPGSGGNGGNGGNGGVGGNGAAGGNAGTILINFPFGYDVTRVTTDVHGGIGGIGGQGGAGGTGGSAGSFGANGHGGSVFGCDAGRDGGGGSGGTPGTPGTPGNTGGAGTTGTPGGVTWNPTDGPSGGGDQGGYEPGGMGGGECTEWWWVWYHCELIDEEEASVRAFGRRAEANHSVRSRKSTDDYECIEEDRWYIGCF